MTTDLDWRKDLDESRIRQNSGGVPWGRTMRIVETVDSTNAELLRDKGDAAQEGTVLIADRQSAGRGRNRRNWYSPPGLNIAMSILLQPRLAPQNLPSAVLPISLGVCLALEEVSGCAMGIKWPNDIVFQDKKICGILGESKLLGGTVERLVMGIGVNVNAEAFPLEIEEFATSLLRVTGRKTARDVLVGILLRNCYHCYHDYYLREEREKVWRDYCEHSAILHRQVSISRVALMHTGEGIPALSGVVESIDMDGRLTLRKQDGSRESFAAGEVSLRPQENNQTSGGEGA